MGFRGHPSAIKEEYEVPSEIRARMIPQHLVASGDLVAHCPRTCIVVDGDPLAKKTKISVGGMRCSPHVPA